MGAEFTFVATSDTSKATLYEAAWQAHQYWAGYLLPDNGVSPPQIISYSDSLSAIHVHGVWSPVYAGWYLFAPKRPSALDLNPDAVIDNIQNYVQTQKLDTGSQVILWIQHVDPLTFGAQFASYSIVFTCNASYGTFSTTSNWNAQLGQDLSFNILANVALKIDKSSGSLQFSVPVDYVQGIAFQRADTSMGITLLEDDCGINAYLPFTGTNVGCCLFSATIKPVVTFGTGGLPVGFFYSATETTSTVADAFTYPVFAAAALPATLLCNASVDVLDPFNQLMSPSALTSGVLRTGFALAANVALPSFFSDVQGNAISLWPLAGATAQAPQLGLQAGALALTTNAMVPSDPAAAVPCLTLTGRFGVNAAKQEFCQPVELLCGIFGSERIALAGYDPAAVENENDSLLFCLGGHANAPVFPFLPASLDQPDSGAVTARLDGQRTTAWASVVQGGAATPSYSAEPEGSPMFGFPTDIGEGVIILESQPPSLPIPQGFANAFPLVPYAGLKGQGLSGETLASFESTILAPTRKQIISAAATETWAARASACARSYQARLDRLAGLTAAVEAAPLYRATPHGMIATIDPDSGAYLSVNLGQTLADDGTALPFGFLNLSIALQDALQTNQLFLVVVNPTNLVRTSGDFENILNIAGWKMKADVGTGVSATAYANVMVLKYCSGSFASRISNPNLWTAQADFSLPAGVGSDEAGVCYTGLSAWLQDLVIKAKAAVDDNPQSPYANFVDVVHDAEWNGVLVLQATLDASSLPAGLKGISAGIDMSQFKAHHFGFTASRLSSNRDGTITFKGNSRTFGLVDYANPTFAANLAMKVPPDTPIALPGAGNYAFCVLQLQSLFENSVIAIFKSYIELAANIVFGTSVTTTSFGGYTMPINAVVLDGSYIDQGGAGIYVFVQATPTIFTLDSNVLRAVAFDRVQFNCLGTIDDGATVLNRFLIWGHFDFAALFDTNGAPLDILSFGDPASEAGQTPTGQGLGFSSLLIDMSYPQTTPGAVSFVETTQTLSYDLSDSQYRADSLFPGFSLELSGFIAATDGQQPTDFGYLTVGAPLDLIPLGDPWYGVIYNVTMGGPGALASAAGFSSSLLLAWSPASGAADTAHSLFTGLSLPGTAPGAKLISLQGVFKVAVDGIALSRQQVPDGSDFYYCLRLANIGVKILGVAKLPPDGSINFFLFGNPGSNSGLGWYAAYNRTAGQAAAPAILPP